MTVEMHDDDKAEGHLMMLLPLMLTHTECYY